MPTEKYHLIIIGSGAAGLAAALYAGRYLMKTLVIGKEFGGATSWGGLIENYPGVKSIDGYELMKIMKEQAGNQGVKVIEDEVVEIKEEVGSFRVITRSQHQFLSNTLILAIGSQRRRLNLPNEKELTGRGVHYCVTCDVPFYRNKKIAIVGGGDAAVKAALFAFDYCEVIYLIVRGKKLNAEPINIRQLEKGGSKLKILFETEVREIVGKAKLEKLILSRPYQNSQELLVDGLFIEIGSVPDPRLPQQLKLKVDDQGYVKVDNLMRTSKAGVFAAGDITNFFGHFKQDITAAAMGAVAATSAYEYLKEKGFNF